MQTLLASEALEQLIAAEPSPPSLPGVYRQPDLETVCRGEADVEAWSRQWVRACLRRDTVRANAARQALEQEFAPLLAWALASWDFLLTTEGCRFLLRKPGEKWGARGDYRACEQPDYHRLVVHCFRDCLTRFVQTAHDVALTPYLVREFWPAVRATYDALCQPPDRRQRTLTAYSYLRCIPYRFLNDYHDALVRRVLRTLPPQEYRVLDCYFLHFFTDQAAAEAMSLRPSTMEAYRRQGLRHLAAADSLACALLLQIERY